MKFAKLLILCVIFVILQNTFLMRLSKDDNQPKRTDSQETATGSAKNTKKDVVPILKHREGEMKERKSSIIGVRRTENKEPSCVDPEKQKNKPCKEFFAVNKEDSFCKKDEVFDRCSGKCAKKCAQGEEPKEKEVKPIKENNDNNDSNKEKENSNKKETQNEANKAPEDPSKPKESVQEAEEKKEEAKTEVEVAKESNLEDNKDEKKDSDNLKPEGGDEEKKEGEAKISKRNKETRKDTKKEPVMETPQIIKNKKQEKIFSNSNFNDISKTLFNMEQPTYKQKEKYDDYYTPNLVSTLNNRRSYYS